MGLAGTLKQGNFDQSFERLYAYGEGNCIDTNDNGADFTRNFAPGAANPQNSAAPAVPCGSEPVVPGPANHVVISEFRTDGPGSGTNEFLEVFNPTSATISLNGYTVDDDGGTEFTFGAVDLAPGEHYLIAGIDYVGPQDAVHLGIPNNSDFVELRDSGGLTVHRVDIDNGPGSIPESFDRYEATWQRRADGCADFPQEELNWGWSTIPTPLTWGDAPTPCP
jgi:hypothetical protein